MCLHSNHQQFRLAAALDIWADARERSILDLTERAASLSRTGLDDEARRFSFAARHLRIKAILERAQASAIRNEG